MQKAVRHWWIASELNQQRFACDGKESVIPGCIDRAWCGGNEVLISVIGWN